MAEHDDEAPDAMQRAGLRGEPDHEMREFDLSLPGGGRLEADIEERRYRRFDRAHDVVELNDPTGIAALVQFTTKFVRC